MIGLTVLAAAIRFSTLGLQSYRHDEAVTAGRVLLSGLSQTMHQVWAGESTPPLYYLLAWLWSHLFGVREVGLRSLSALFGTATIPVAYLVGRELIGRRAGLAVAAIVAVSPMLVWYSQDARAYALLVLLSTTAFLFFLRARRPRGRRAENRRISSEIGPSAGRGWDLGWWAVFSALALATHYFAFFPLAIEAVWLLATVRPLRRVLWAVGGVALAGAALAPIALHQAAGKNNNWIATFGMAGRLRETGISFFVGEAGLLKHALVPMALLAAAVALLLLRGGAREKRGAAVALAIGGGSILIALAFAAAGQDFVLERNLLPALIPLALVGAAGIAAPRAGWLGIGVGAALVAYLLAFCVYSDFSPALQRDDFRSVAAAIGPPHGPRAILVWEQGDEPLAFYIGAGETRVKPKQWRRTPRAVSEVDVVSGRPPPPTARSALPTSFHRVQRVTLGRMTLIRYRAARPQRLGWSRIARNFTGYPNNAVLLDRPGG
ncbi:MAG TPA: glycosyltransferase family 39 protein [Solirubrobacterales bacterium]|nr:glycosyltransferase family 39 protein [Solirubrobacterales bacterium]